MYRLNYLLLLELLRNNYNQHKNAIALPFSVRFWLKPTIIIHHGRRKVCIYFAVNLSENEFETSIPMILLMFDAAMYSNLYTMYYLTSYQEIAVTSSSLLRLASSHNHLVYPDCCRPTNTATLHEYEWFL